MTVNRSMLYGHTHIHTHAGINPLGENVTLIDADFEDFAWIYVPKGECI